LVAWLSSDSIQRQRQTNELKTWRNGDRPFPALPQIAHWLVQKQTRTNVVRGQTPISRPTARSLKVLQLNKHSQSVLAFNTYSLRTTSNTKTLFTCYE